MVPSGLAPVRDRGQCDSLCGRGEVRGGKLGGGRGALNVTLPLGLIAKFSGLFWRVAQS